MNRLANLGILPNLSPVIKFVGGPWDGMYTRWSGVGLPEFIDTRNSKTPEAVPHVYQLWVFTDTKGVTHTTYKHRGPNTQKN
jgi:hypothetical protein